MWRVDRKRRRVYEQLGAEPSDKDEEIALCATAEFADRIADAINRQESISWQSAPVGGRKVMLSLCDYSGVMCAPWVDAGYRAIAVDITHPDGVTYVNGVECHGVDLSKEWLPPLAEYAFVAAFPPCTNLATAGAKFFQRKGIGALIEGLTLVERCRQIAEWSGAPWLIENPRSTLTTYWRKPDYTFYPYEYGGYEGGEDDDYMKHTCIWTGGGLAWPETKPIPLAEDGRTRLRNLGESKSRTAVRSRTPPGFAQAIFEANHKVD